MWIYEEIPKGIWIFIATTRDEETGEVCTYINGELQNSAESSPEGQWVDHIPCMSGTQLRIGGGRISGDYVQFFNGAIDDIRIYNGALSSEEVQRLYQYTKPSYL